MSLAARFTLSGDKTTWGWDCKTCIEEGKDTLRNCNDESNQGIGWVWAPELRRCPWSQIDAQAWDVITSWQQWRTFGSTPWGRDPLVAPAWWVEAIEMCENIRANAEEKAANERTKASEKRMKGTQHGR